MKIITHEEISRLNISGEKMFNWVDETLYSKRLDILPPKLSLKPENEVFFNIMPTIIPNQKIAGVKVVNRYPDRTPVLDSQILLYDLENGNCKALMDGNYITTARTGAVAAHSIRLFAVPEFFTIGMIGLGNQGRAVVKVLAALYPDRKLRFKLKRYKKQHEIFAEYLKKIFTNEVEILYTTSYEETIQESDIIISSVTYFDNDIISDLSLFKPGCLLIPIHTRGFMECDRVFDKVYADDQGHVENFKYFKNYNFFSEVTDVLLGNSPGRESLEERIIVYNIGLAVHDIYFASSIYDMLSNSTIEEKDLLSPTQKFWFK